MSMLHHKSVAASSIRMQFATKLPEQTSQALFLVVHLGKQQKFSLPLQQKLATAAVESYMEILV